MAFSGDAAHAVCRAVEYAAMQKGHCLMRKPGSLTVLAGFVAALAMPALAQTTTTLTGPQDCKANGTWDTATRTCKPKG